MPAPKANGTVMLMVRVGGETHALQIRDLLCVSIATEDGGSVRILPGTVGRCLQLGADALVAEQLTKKVEELARECAVPPANNYDADVFDAATTTDTAFKN